MPIPVAGVAVGVAGALSGRALLNALSTAKSIKTVADQMGTLIDEVAVTVVGTPLSSKRDLYFLAAAVGFGLVQRLVPAGGKLNPFGSPGRVGVHYDPTKKEVTFVLHYQQNIMTIVGTKVMDDVFGLPLPFVPPIPNLPTVYPGSKTREEITAKTPVLSGPRDEVVGQPWGFGLPMGSAFAFKTPDLPFAGRTVLTDQFTVRDPNPNLTTPGIIPTPNPRPSGDSRSRGSLCWLVYQSLATPAESNEGTGSHTYVMPTPSNRFSGG